MTHDIFTGSTERKLNMESMELISFQIISAVGTAKSMYIEAIREAKNGNFDQADQLIKEGAKTFLEGHKAHASLIQKEASGEKVEFSLLLMHAEDQLMNAETTKLMAEEIIELYRTR
jgi:PTS system cellobiose-specific IIA component